MTVATYHLERNCVPLDDEIAREQAGDTLSGIARHVTQDGCQFVITGPAPKPGCRLTCQLGINPPIAGVVRWIVEDRIGFAFDGLLDSARLTELVNLGVQVSAIPLEASEDPADRR